jgi:hypothetical protein
MNELPAAGSGKLSGDVESPCPPASEGSRRLPEAAMYLGMLRPFPVRRLHDLLYHVVADVAHIERVLGGLLLEPPSRIEQWTWALDQIDTALWSLEQRAQAVRPEVDAMHDTADAEAARAQLAMRWIMSGLDA